MSDFDDKKLEDFLKTHQPTAPKVERDQLNGLLSELGLVKKSKKSLAPSSWIVLGRALAASVTVFMLLTQSPNLDELPNQSEMSWEEDGLYVEELPALDVGEDYYEFVASNTSK